MNNYDIVTSAWIEAQLNEKNISQKAFAEALNISKSHANQWVHGGRNPSASAKVAIYNFFENK